MTPSNTIEELVGRVEAATVGNYFLDEEIHIAFGNPERGLFDPPDASKGEQVSHTDAGQVWKLNRWRDGYSSSTPVPKYTASIDAALALAERVLPGWTVQIFQLRRDKGWGARVSSPRYDTYSSFEDDEHATDDGFRGQANGALALLVAILKALRSLRIKGDKP